MFSFQAEYRGTRTIITKTLGTENTPISANLDITHREGSGDLFHNSQVYHPHFCLTGIKWYTMEDVDFHTGRLIVARETLIHVRVSKPVMNISPQ